MTIALYSTQHRELLPGRAGPFPRLYLSFRHREEGEEGRREKKRRRKGKGQENQHDDLPRHRCLNELLLIEPRNP